jgi:hypothetical protein
MIITLGELYRFYGMGLAASFLLGLWVRIPPRARISLVGVVCCKVEAAASG